MDEADEIEDESVESYADNEIVFLCPHHMQIEENGDA